MIRAGTRIGPLKVERALGVGGMGEVYLARDERLERHVAVKTLPEGRQPDPTARGRMLREARAASALAGTIDDAGRALVAVDVWAGELWLARAPAGAPW